MTQPGGQDLFLLAGYPASGKSTLLAHGVLNRAEVFGEEYDPGFRATVTTTDFDENAWTRNKLDKGMWFTLADVNELERLDALPRNMTFHLDLLLFLLVVIEPKSASQLNRRTVAAAFRGLLERRLFSAYERIIACTLYPQFDTVRGNWKRRVEQGMALDDHLLSAKHDLILNVPNAEIFYQGICHEWTTAVAARAHSHCIRQWRPAGTIPQDIS